nr:MAG TPA: hypothetical protein [Caudoviricetes sp.]
MEYNYTLTQITNRWDSYDDGYIGGFDALSPYLSTKEILEQLCEANEWDVLKLEPETLYLVSIWAPDFYNSYYFETDKTGKACYLLIKACVESLQ